MIMLNFICFRKGIQSKIREKTPCCLPDSEMLLMLLRIVLLTLVMLLMLGGKLEIKRMLLGVELLVLLMMFIVELLLLVMLLKGKLLVLLMMFMVELLLLKGKLLLMARVGRTMKVKRVERPTNSQHSSNSKITRCRVNKLLCLKARPKIINKVVGHYSICTLKIKL
jgi:hypothetical protein